MDEEEQYDQWRKEYANLLLRAGEAVVQMQLFSPEDANPGWYVSRIMWCEQEAEEVWPQEHSWPKDQTTAEIYDFNTKQRVNK